jgi:hypothetical protein
MKSLLEEIRDLNNWDYYNREEKVEIPFDGSDDVQKHKDFIRDYLEISGKESIERYFFTEELKKQDISLDTFDRAVHSNSVFFIGMLLYEKLKLKDKIKFVREDGNKDEFPFIWFLISLVHDFGYFAEKDKSKFTHITEDISKWDLTHKLLDYKKRTNKYLCEAYKSYGKHVKTIIDAIPSYFEDAFNGKKSSTGKKKIEHGIYAGLLLYDGLVKNRIERKDQRSNTLYWNDDLDKFYAIAAFAIAIHNMRRDGISEDAEKLKFSIYDEPFLFLFALADTLEPTKIYTDKKAASILDSILIYVKENKIMFRKANNSNIDFSKLVERACGLATWLNIKVCIKDDSLEISWDDHTVWLAKKMN